MLIMPEGALARAATVDPRKFKDADVTAADERRAAVAFTALHTLWFNTGTLCNPALHKGLSLAKNLS